MIKSELKSIKERFSDKKSLLQSYAGESDFLLKQINSISTELYDKKTTDDKVDELKMVLAQKRELLENLKKREIELKNKKS